MCYSNKGSTMKNKILFIITFLFVSISSLSYAQTSERPSDWQIYTEVNGVIFYYKYAECNDFNQGIHREYVILKLVNTTSTSLMCEWDNELWYAEKCTSCPDKDEARNPELHRKITLSAGGSKEGSCSITESKELKIFSKHLNYNAPNAELSGFDLININVYPTE